VRVIRIDPSLSPLQLLASGLGQVLHLSVDDQDYDDSAQNECPIGNWNARYRCLLAEPFHDFPPVLQSSSGSGFGRSG
jgi:hypothetical protein